MSNLLVTPSRTVESRTYTLSFTDGVPTGCTCPGFAYRGRCRHITEHTGGTFLAYCTGCLRDEVRAATYDAARAVARAHGGRSSCCGQMLAVTTDWGARDALRAASRLAQEAAAIVMGGAA